MSFNVAGSGTDVSAAIAALQADHRALDRRVGGVEASITGLRGDMDVNHRENRGSIHAVRDGQQTIAEAMRVGMDKISDKIGERFAAVEEDVLDLRLKYAKATGYAVGVSALGAVVFELVKVWIEHARH